jgi:hypothetical protein
VVPHVGEAETSQSASPRFALPSVLHMFEIVFFQKNSPSPGEEEEKDSAK